MVGVNTAIYSPSGGNVGIAFAIPAKTASEVVEQLEDLAARSSAAGSACRIQSVDEDMAASLGLSETKGALVNDVTTPGPAAEAGIKNGDTILSVNGIKIADSRDLARQIATFAPGTKVDVKVLRAPARADHRASSSAPCPPPWSWPRPTPRAGLRKATERRSSA